VLEQTKDVEQNLPFPLLGMDFDNGGEWLNWHLVQYLQERVAPVKLTRSRPYHNHHSMKPTAVHERRRPRAGTSIQQEMTFAGCAPVIIERVVGQGTKREPMFLPLAAS